LIKNYVIFLLFFGLLINISAQDSINGTWQYKTMGHHENLGIYELSINLNIQNGKYTWIAERISEKAMYWSSGERGSITVNNSEIIFLKEEQAYGQWDLRWETENGSSTYVYFIYNNILILIQENEVLVFGTDN